MPARLHITGIETAGACVKNVQFNAHLDTRPRFFVYLRENYGRREEIKAPTEKNISRCSDIVSAGIIDYFGGRN